MRTRVFAGIILSLFAILVAGLFYNQVVQHDLYWGLSERNRIRALSLEAPRGRIYDRKEKLIVSNRISFDVEVIYSEIKDSQEIIDSLSGVAGVEKSVLSEKIKKARENPFVPVAILKDIGKEKAIRIEEVRMDLPGVIITTRPVRNYIYGDVLCHVLGYLGKINESELGKQKTYGYCIQDFVGRDGIERRYNNYLRGANGGVQVEVDNRGRQLRLLAVKEPRAGRDLYLSIDLDLQRFCDSLITEKRGAIVAMNPATGAILAITSHPGYDPNIFVGAGNHRQISSLLNDTREFPMLNRAIASSYPPGSIFKIVTAIAGLDSGKFNDVKTFFCSGSYKVGNRAFNCWREKGHGPQDVIESLKNSCNAFYYQLGILLGVNEISDYAFKFGLGKVTGIDLPGETAGNVPTPAWKRRRFGDSWFKGETANYAIGQGYLMTSPLQIARLVSVVANGGKLVQPFIVEKIEDVTLSQPEPTDLKFKEETVAIIKEALREVVNAPRGTGLFARSKEIFIAGKTGTAQNPSGTSHAWFAGFAPFKNPKLCVVVFIEHGGKGGLDPARFTKKIVEEAKRLELI